MSKPLSKMDQLPANRALKSSYASGRGLFVILINTFFGSIDTQTEKGEIAVRQGANYDFPIIMRVVGRLVEDVENDVMWKFNLKAAEIKQVIKEVKNTIEDSRKYDYVFFVFSSHGSENLISGTDCKNVNINIDILEPFRNQKCKALQGKLKFFLFQSCRGTKVHNFSPAKDTGKDLKILSVGDPLRIYPEVASGSTDFLCIFATVPGYTAQRQFKEGSLLIKCLFANIEKLINNGKLHSTDLMTILLSVREELKNTKPNPMLIDIQPPLDKAFYFPLRKTAIEKELEQLFLQKEKQLKLQMQKSLDSSKSHCILY